MRIVVTGAFGFVGLNVTRTLAEQGHDVLAVGRSNPDGWVTAFLSDQCHRVEYRRADLAKHGSLADALETEAVDAVIHAAVVTATTLEVERDSASWIVAVNTSGTMEALDLARTNGARRFVYVSSPSAIGVMTSELVDETVIPEPVTIYGITKYASEMLVRRYAAIHDMTAASIRIAQPYGPGERATPSRPRTSPIYEWLEAAVAGETLVAGPGTVARDWTLVDETARGIADLATAPSLSHDLYHLGTGRLATVDSVTEQLRRAFPNVHVDNRDGLMEINPNIATPTRRILDATRFGSEFGWAPSVTIQDGMRRYLDWRRSWTGGA